MTTPFGDAGDARFMPRNPLEDEDSASLRRQLAMRPEFSDISRMSDAQVRAHVADLRSTGKLAPQHEYTPVQQAHATVISAKTVEMAMPAKEQAPTRGTIEFKVLTVTPDGDKPVADINIKTRLPGDRKDTGATDKQGLLKFGDIKDGTCSIEEMFTVKGMWVFDSIESA